MRRTTHLWMLAYPTKLIVHSIDEGSGSPSPSGPKPSVLSCRQPADRLISQATKATQSEPKASPPSSGTQISRSWSVVDFHLVVVTRRRARLRLRLRLRPRFPTSATSAIVPLSCKLQVYDCFVHCDETNCRVHVGLCAFPCLCSWCGRRVLIDWLRTGEVGGFRGRRVSCYRRRNEGLLEEGKMCRVPDPSCFVTC
jgi:hypothetical protein